MGNVVAADPGAHERGVPVGVHFGVENACRGVGCDGHGHMLAQVAEEFLGTGYEVHTGVNNICFDARKFSERIVLMLGVFLGVVRIAGV